MPSSVPDLRPPRLPAPGQRALALIPLVLLLLLALPAVQPGPAEDAKRATGGQHDDHKEQHAERSTHVRTVPHAHDWCRSATAARHDIGWSSASRLLERRHYLVREELHRAAHLLG